MNKKKSIILKLLKEMYLVRLTDTYIAEKYSEQKMRCPIHLSLGQEGPSAAMCLNLKKNDLAISYHRSHAHYLNKGGSLKKFIAELYGKKTGCSKGIGGSMHLIDLKKNFLGSTAIVSNSIPVGVGYAFSKKLKKSNSRVCIFLGDAGTEEGVFYESANFAALKNLPVVFFCENNKYSVYSNLSKRQPKNRKIFQMVKSLGIESYKINSYKPFEIYSFIKKKLKKNLQKPIFFEVDTYRYYEHCGPNPDDDLNYRPEKEVKLWKNRDPINLTENFGFSNKLIDKNSINKIKNKIKKNILKSFLDAEKAKPLSFTQLKKFL